MQVSFLVIAISVVVVALAIRNLYVGISVLNKKEHPNVVWHKQHNMLVGIVYLILATLFILDTIVRSKSTNSSTFWLGIELVLAIVGLVFAARLWLLLRASKKV